LKPGAFQLGVRGVQRAPPPPPWTTPLNPACAMNCRARAAFTAPVSTVTSVDPGGMSMAMLTAPVRCKKCDAMHYYAEENTRRRLGFVCFVFYVQEEELSGLRRREEAAGFRVFCFLCAGRRVEWIEEAGRRIVREEEEEEDEPSLLLTVAQMRAELERSRGRPLLDDFGEYGALGFSDVGEPASGGHQKYRKSKPASSGAVEGRRTLQGGHLEAPRNVTKITCESTPANQNTYAIII
jgi:hypothetical protein